MNNIKKKRKKSWFWYAVVFLFSLFFILSGFFIIWLSNLKIPDFKQFNERKVESSTKIYDRTGEVLLYDVHRDIKRTIIPFEEIGENLIKATVAIEDSEFYNHKGIRLSSILRATVWAKLTGRKIQGGSTITQQVIKNTILTSEVSLARKIKEWMLSFKLEQSMSKNEILALYLNEAPYGGNIYGVKEASNLFFGKDPMDLSLAESAYMAAIPNGPTYYSPYGKNIDKLENRKNLVLSRILEVGLINKEEHKKAREEEVVFLPQQKGGILAPHFVFYIKDYLDRKYGKNTLEEGGLKIITSLDYDLQERVEKIVFEKSKENEINWGGKNAAAVVIDPKNGEILAMVGSKDYFNTTEIDGNFNVVTAPRQPGSSFKPIVYALAFEKGYTDETVLFDVRTEFNSSCNPGGFDNKDSCYHPNNWNFVFIGPVNLRNALAQSINIIAVKLLHLVGVSDSIKMAQNLGITTLKNDPNLYGLSLVIGGGETTLLDMTSVYGVFANEGIRNDPISILEIYDKKDNLLEEFKSNPHRVLSSNTTRVVSSILSDNEARTPAFGAYSLLKIGGIDSAVKTGTTNDNKDAWTIGYTPNVAVGVWVGNNDNVPMKKGGVAMAGPIWNAIMLEAVKGKPVERFEKPEPNNQLVPPFLRGVWQNGKTYTIDTISNKLATEFTPEETKKEVFDYDVHTILHWIDKKDIFNQKEDEVKDPLYNNWEFGVNKWWEENKNNFPVLPEIPSEYDDVHTYESLPVFEIIGLKNKEYNKNDLIEIEIELENEDFVKKIDVFINNTYLTFLKNKPFYFGFKPLDIPDIENNNFMKIIIIDNIGNISEEIFPFKVK